MEIILKAGNNYSLKYRDDIDGTVECVGELETIGFDLYSGPYIDIIHEDGCKSNILVANIINIKEV